MSESKSEQVPPPTKVEAAEALRAATQARASLAAGVESPPGWDVAYGAGVGVFVASGGVLGSGDGLAPQLGATAMALAAAFLFGQLMSRWRKRNGVWVSGLRPGSTLGFTAAVGVVLIGLYLSAFFSAQSGLWWLTGLVAVAGAVGGWWATRRWMDVYRAEARAEVERASQGSR